MQINNRRNERGIALISVALFVMVMGVLMFSAIYVLKTQSVVKSEQKNIGHSIAIQDAIENYVAINSRYPCPAVMDAAPDTSDFGMEARVPLTDLCNDSTLFQVTSVDGSTDVFIGAVPVRTLNIPDEMMADGNRQRYIFAMSGNMADGSEDPKYGQGGITILDRAGGSSLTIPRNRAVYALISPGADERGAFDLSGVPSQQACPTAAQNADAHENCDFDDAVFVAKSEKISGNTVADYTASVAFVANPTAFDWVAEPWRSCVPKGARRCFDGTQARDVNCVSRDGKSSADPFSGITENDCAHTVKPDGNRNCDLGPCRWEASCSGTPPTEECVPGTTSETVFTETSTIYTEQSGCTISPFGSTHEETVRNRVENSDSINDIPSMIAMMPSSRNITLTVSPNSSGDAGTVTGSWSYEGGQGSGMASSSLPCEGYVTYNYVTTTTETTCPTSTPNEGDKGPSDGYGPGDGPTGAGSGTSTPGGSGNNGTSGNSGGGGGSSGGGGGGGSSGGGGPSGGER